MTRYVASYLVQHEYGQEISHGLIVREYESPEIFFIKVRKELKYRYANVTRVHLGNICKLEDLLTSENFKFYEFE